jgi:hypothetical protein
VQLGATGTTATVDIVHDQIHLQFLNSKDVRAMKVATLRQSARHGACCTITWCYGGAVGINHEEYVERLLILLDISHVTVAMVPGAPRVLWRR